MKKISLLTLAFISLMACQNDDAGDVNTVNTEPVNIAFETLESGFFGSYTAGATTPQNFVINNPADWDAFANVYYDPVNPVTVDYGQKTVISGVGEFRAGMGESDRFEVASITQQNDTIHVNIHSVAGLNETVMTITYQPYHIVSIPKTTLPFKFTYTE